jgi:hypothetical protein
MNADWDRDRVSGLLGEHAMSLLLGLLAALCAVLSLVQRSPQAADLVEVSGAVARADIYRHCRGRVFCEHALLVTIDGQPGRFRLEPPLQVLQIPGTAVRTFTEREPSRAPDDGDAVRTWGLWVNGRAVRPADEAIDDDGFIAHRVLPVVSLVLAGLAASRVLLR